MFKQYQISRLRLRFTVIIVLFFCCSLIMCGGAMMYDATYAGACPPGGQAMDMEDAYYPGGETFAPIEYNQFMITAEDNLSTFATDVDTGSYTFGRSQIEYGQLPPKDSVRVEEYINYFNQDYTPPLSDPFSVSVDGAPSIFREAFHILRIGIRGRNIKPGTQKPWNLTFLVDVSGSMEERLPIVKECLVILVDNMRATDKISLCTYAGSVETIIEPTKLDDKDEIKDAIDDLGAGGGTAMASGIQNAYDTNMQGFIPEGVNRIIVCSDGDANIGSTNHEAILDMISNYVDRGITLSTIGFGIGNYNDYMMEQLADNGNGNYFYVDSITEGRKLFTQDLLSVMEIIAKDVKVQVEFNANEVNRYRLIGYENRAIPDEEFEDETTDAGEIGAGHRVTALYEIELTGNNTEDLGIVHLRYKLPDGNTDIPLDVAITQDVMADSFAEASTRFRFTVGVAEFAEILRESPHINTTFSDVEKIISESLTTGDIYDAEFLNMVRKTIEIAMYN